LTKEEVPTYNFATRVDQKTPAIRAGLLYRVKHCLSP
jgi:hypothetical protein